jgi:hypothetical protein
MVNILVTVLMIIIMIATFMYMMMLLVSIWYDLLKLFDACLSESHHSLEFTVHD